MIDPLRIELLDLIQASVGWTLLAARSGKAGAEAAGEIVCGASGTPATPPLRLRATITVDIDARDLDEAERQSEDIRVQFERLKSAHPTAVLVFQRRKPRTSRRPPAPAVVVNPYADD